MAKNIETKVCGICHKSSVLTVTDAEWAAIQSGVHMQAALPHWSAAQREMLITGTHPECWEILFPKCTMCGLAMEGEEDAIQDPLTQKWKHNVCPDVEDQ